MKKISTRKLLLLMALTALLVLAVGAGVEAASAEVTWNPSDKASAIKLSNNNLTASNIGARKLLRATTGKSSGKWYWEVTVNGAYATWVGVANKNVPTTVSAMGTEGVKALYSNNGAVTYPTKTFTSKFGNGTIISILLDLDNGTIEFWKNGSSLGVAYTDLASIGAVYPMAGSGSDASPGNVTANFGATPFVYPVPEDYQPYDSEILPAAPTNLIATPGDTQVSLSWTAVDGANIYNVKRATTAGGPYIEIATNVTATSYTDTGLTNGTTYYYVVSAVGTGGESANSNEASATPQAELPNAPTGLTATAGEGQVSLSWTAVTGATSYKVKRSETAGGPYTEVGDLAGTTMTDTGLTNGTTYYYVVTAVTVSGESGNSNEASATPQATPSGANGTLIVTVANNADREYNLTIEEIQGFITWYANRSTGGNIYIINMGASGAYSNIKDYLVFDKIVAWKVMEY